MQTFIIKYYKANMFVQCTGVCIISTQISTTAHALSQRESRRHVGLVVLDSRDQYPGLFTGLLISEQVIRHNTRLYVLHGH